MKSALQKLQMNLAVLPKVHYFATQKEMHLVIKESLAFILD